MHAHVPDRNLRDCFLFRVAQVSGTAAVIEPAGDEGFIATIIVKGSASVGPIE